MNLKKLWKTVKMVTDNHGPAVLSGFAIVGVIGTVYLAVKATPKAMYILEQKKEEGASGLETAKALAPVVAPAAAAGAATIGSIVLSHKMNVEKIATLTSALSIAQNTHSMYKEQIKEYMPEDTIEKMERKISKKIAEESPSRKDNSIINTGHGNVLCMDALSGRMFRSDGNYIEKVMNMMNNQLRNEMSVGLGELYSELGLPQNEFSRRMGWKIDHGEIQYRLDSDIFEDTNEPYILFRILTLPQDYYGKTIW